MDHLYSIANKKSKNTGIWETASRFYYSVDAMNETEQPAIVFSNWNDKK